MKIVLVFLFLVVYESSSDEFLLKHPRDITDDMKFNPWMVKFIEYSNDTRVYKICCLTTIFQKIEKLKKEIDIGHKKIIYRPQHLEAEFRDAQRRLKSIWKRISDALRAHESLEKSGKGGVQSLIKSSEGIFSMILEEIEAMLRYEGVQPENKAYRTLFFKFFKTLNTIMGRSLKCMYDVWDKFDTHINIKYF
ncbi:uncharacterized protein LOC108028110 isoform X1 [Drosophila biarmipes]|uniref:uncharacterized protein LOC108028110 isoform X1 n=1 Tax=Drosophila biarmipes TaxID=125945 RepID=UPI0021CD0964|nr:uncharacterized protein LOC108028110 isoform X1 [Drosophila biarmipes]